MSSLDFAIALKTVAQKQVDEIDSILYNQRLRWNRFIEIKKWPKKAAAKTAGLMTDLMAEAVKLDEMAFIKAEYIANEFADDWEQVWNNNLPLHKEDEIDKIYFAALKAHKRATFMAESASQEEAAMEAAVAEGPGTENAKNAQIRNIGIKIAVANADQAWAIAASAAAEKDEERVINEISDTEQEKDMATRVVDIADEMKMNIRDGTVSASVNDINAMIMEKMKLQGNQVILYNELVEEAKKEAILMEEKAAALAASLVKEAEVTGPTDLRREGVVSGPTGLTRESASTSGVTTFPTTANTYEYESTGRGGTRKNKKHTKRHKKRTKRHKKHTKRHNIKKGKKTRSYRIK